MKHRIKRTIIAFVTVLTVLFGIVPVQVRADNGGSEALEYWDGHWDGHSICHFCKFGDGRKGSVVIIDPNNGEPSYYTNMQREKIDYYEARQLLFNDGMSTDLMNEFMTVDVPDEPLGYNNLYDPPKPYYIADEKPDAPTEPTESDPVIQQYIKQGFKYVTREEAKKMIGRMTNHTYPWCKYKVVYGGEPIHPTKYVTEMEIHDGIFGTYREITNDDYHVFNTEINNGNITYTATETGISGTIFNGNDELTLEQYIWVENYLADIAKQLNTGTLYEKLAKARDWVCDRYTYDGDGHKTVYDSLQTNSGVCMNYAETFQLLMEQMGIESYLWSTGKGHALNIVRFENQYYFVDTTFYDQDKSGFLAGLDDPVTNYYPVENLTNKIKIAETSYKTEEEKQEEARKKAQVEAERAERNKKVIVNPKQDTVTQNTPILPTGWQQKDDNWYYYDKGLQTLGWKEIDGEKYYFDIAGRMVTGWQKISGTTYFFDNNGVLQSGWRKNATGWWYVNDDGTYPAGIWQKINGLWYYFDSNGYMTTGWQMINDTWYYLDESGAMTTGWQMINGIWYYFDESGAMTTGWHDTDGVTYFFDNSGALQSGWRKNATGWWYVNDDGTYPAGIWQKIDGLWYYFDSNGYMTTGWQMINDTWYYLDEAGTMATDWKEISGKWYYFDESGAMASSTWIGNYYLTDNGSMATSQFIGQYYVGPDGMWVAK